MKSKICHVTCLKEVMAEGEFSVERRRLGLKPRGGKVQAGEFQFAVPVLQTPPEGARGKTAPINHCLTHPVEKGMLGEGGFPHVLQLFQRSVPVMVSRG